VDKNNYTYFAQNANDADYMEIEHVFGNKRVNQERMLMDKVKKERLLTEKEVAKRLNVSVGLLRKWRWTKKGGPTYYRINHRSGGRIVRYGTRQLREWLSEQAVQPSTNEFKLPAEGVQA
jgi:hypothetical protein